MLKEGASGAWDSGGTETPTVLKIDSSHYFMWYGGYTFPRPTPPVGMQIGVATSSDGINWVKYAGNPVLGFGAQGTWDGAWVESPTVVKVGSTFYMWYSGIDSSHTYRIGMATSADGEIWTKYASNPVLSSAAETAWENGAVYAPSVFYDGSQFKMFYVGLNSVTFINACRIGMATPTDGISWTRWAHNPVLDVGDSGSWDANGPFVPTVILRNNKLLMWYLSGSSPNEGIGLATWVQ